MTHIACPHCGGEGRNWTSRYGDNDPDVWDAGSCDACEGSGDAHCNECGGPATHSFRYRGDDYPMCVQHYTEWRADEDCTETED